MRGFSNHRLEYFRCPFFLGHAPIEIACEGITPDCRIRLLFTKKEARERHEEIFCCDRYHYCELYQAIYKQYEEDDP